MCISKNIYTHDNRVNSDCRKLCRSAMQLWAAGYALGKIKIDRNVRR